MPYDTMPIWWNADVPFCAMLSISGPPESPLQASTLWASFVSAQSTYLSNWYSLRTAPLRRIFSLQSLLVMTVTWPCKRSVDLGPSSEMRPHPAINGLSLKKLRVRNSPLTGKQTGIIRSTNEIKPCAVMMASITTVNTRLDFTIEFNVVLKI